MQYEQKNYDNLIGMKGFSETMLKNHFTLYGGYVKNVNAVLEKLKTLKANDPEWNELKRRYGWEFNGMRMHEYYFGGMTKDFSPVDENSEIYKTIVKNFGTFDAWLADLKATGLVRGIGWVALAKDPETGMLWNLWIGEHDEGHLCDQKILLVMDIWEHAYVLDYGLNKAEYINTFINSIDWKEVEKRFNK